MNNLWPKVETLVAEHETLAQEATTALPRGIALAGGGFYGQVAARYLRDRKANITCVMDNASDKQGGQFEGVAVVSSETLAKKKPQMTLITARHAILPITKQLNDLGVPCLSFDAFFVQQNFARLQAVRNDLLSDERSRYVFDSLLLSLLTGDARHCAAVMEQNQYFALPQFVNTGYGHYVDAGAYVGDSIERYIWAHNGIFKTIYAFEPGPRQFSALNARMERLSKEWAFDDSVYHCIKAGLGDREEDKSFSTPAGSLQIGGFNDSEEGDLIPIMTLDGYLKGRPVTCIKADIEGAEMSMLRGAAATIKKHKPNLAISIYHKPDDFYTIPEYIKSLVPEYRMSIRQHSPMMMDTVLYCWTEGAL